MASDLSEHRLVLRAQCGDRAALERLITGVASNLQRFLHHQIDRPDLADDALQETLMVICRKLHWLREPRAFRPWAYRVAHRMALRLLRRERHTPLLGLECAETVPDPEAVRLIEAGIERSAMLRLLESLPPAARVVLQLHYVEGLTLVEVAEVLELALGTTKSRLAYGLQKLRGAGEI